MLDVLSRPGRTAGLGPHKLSTHLRLCWLLRVLLEWDPCVASPTHSSWRVGFWGHSTAQRGAAFPAARVWRPRPRPRLA